MRLMIRPNYFGQSLDGKLGDSHRVWRVAARSFPLAKSIAKQSVFASVMFAASSFAMRRPIERRAVHRESEPTVGVVWSTLGSRVLGGKAFICDGANSADPPCERNSEAVDW